MTSTVPGDCGVEADLGLVEPEAVLTELEIFFDRPAQPGRADRPGRGRRMAFGQVAVVKGELAGGQVAADQQAGRPMTTDVTGSQTPPCYRGPWLQQNSWRTCRVWVWSFEAQAEGGSSRRSPAAERDEPP
jgi:hypothetical protein